MHSMHLGALVQELQGREADISITGIQEDSRKVRPGDAFVALSQSKTIALKHADQAALHGASVILRDKKLSRIECNISVVEIEKLEEKLGQILSDFYGCPEMDEMPIIAVTGTNGKSTVAWKLAYLLQKKDGASLYVGTLGVGIVPEPLQDFSMTTPVSTFLHQTIHAAYKQQVRSCVLEASSHGLAQQRLKGIAVHTSIFTNLSIEHLDYHADMYQYGAAKRLLFKWPSLKNAVINIDDPFGLSLAADIGAEVTKVTYGVSPHAMVRMRDICSDLSGTSWQLESPWGKADVKIQSFGSFNAYNMTAVIAAYCQLGGDFEQAIKYVAFLPEAPGRMQVIKKEGAPTVIVDYAHTPDALDKVLQEVAQVTKGALYCILGCGGQRDKIKRPIMARTAEKYADQLVFTNDNPRLECPKAIVNDMLAGLKHKHKDCIVLYNREEAIENALNRANADDVIVIAGKGHETYQLIGTERLFFDDVSCVKKYLGE